MIPQRAQVVPHLTLLFLRLKEVTCPCSCFPETQGLVLWRGGRAREGGGGCGIGGRGIGWPKEHWTGLLSLGMLACGWLSAFCLVSLLGL